MPTYEPSESFLHDFRQLSLEEQAAFRRAVRHFVADLQRGQSFRAGLRIRGIRGMPGCFELTWAPDGRAIFTYGSEIMPGQSHIIWLAIGTHAILP